MTNFKNKNITLHNNKVCMNEHCDHECMCIRYHAPTRWEIRNFKSTPIFQRKACKVRGFSCPHDTRNLNISTKSDAQQRIDAAIKELKQKKKDALRYTSSGFIDNDNYYQGMVKMADIAIALLQKG